MSDTQWHEVADLADFWEGEIFDFELDGEEVLLVHLDGGGIRAYQGMCPHQEISLADGDWDVDSGILLCTGHNWEFDMKSGEATNPLGCVLYEYPVKIVGEKVKVGVPQDGERHYNRWPPT